MHERSCPVAIARLLAAASAGAAIQQNLAWEPMRRLGKLRLSVVHRCLFGDVPLKNAPKVKAAGLDCLRVLGWRGRDMNRLARIREELGPAGNRLRLRHRGPLVALQRQADIAP